MWGVTTRCSAQLTGSQGVRGPLCGAPDIEFDSPLVATLGMDKISDLSCISGSPYVNDNGDLKLHLSGLKKEGIEQGEIPRS